MTFGSEDALNTALSGPEGQAAVTLREGRIHLGLGARYPDEPGIAVRRMLREPLSVALPDSHPAVGYSAIALADLRTKDLVLFPAAPRP